VIGDNDNDDDRDEEIFVKGDKEDGGKGQARKRRESVDD
jgi:hypothetical protein